MHFLSTQERVFLVCLITAMLVLIVYAVYNRVTYKQEIAKKVHIIDTVTEGIPKKSELSNVVSRSSCKGTIDNSVSTWNKIAKQILENYSGNDIIIVIIQPDILPYIAAAVSFMIENLDKSVIFTTNYTESLYKRLQTTSIPEVMVAQGDTLFRASRITPNMVSIGYPELTEKNCLSIPKKGYPVKTKYINPDIKVSIVYVYPGMNSINVSPKEIHGVILVCWENGKIPKSIIKQLTELTKVGVTVVAISDRAIRPEINQVDARLIEAGAIYGADMTIPAAYAKLQFLMSHVPNRKLIGKMVETNLRGEIST